jgi:maleate isomerase
MESGPEGEAVLVEQVVKECGAECFSTAKAVLEAMNSLSLRRVVLLSPYTQAVNDRVEVFLAAHGVEVVHDETLDAHSGRGPISVLRWIELAQEHAGIPSDGYLLSCTNTNQIEAIEAIEHETGKPAVNSNQAVLWTALKRLGLTDDRQYISRLGRLFGKPAHEPPAELDFVADPHSMLVSGNALV